MSSKDKNKNAKIKMTTTNTKKTIHKKKDEDENILLEYIEDVDDKLFKKYSNSKDFNSLINEFNRATNKIIER